MDQITAMPTVGQADFGPMPSASKKALAQALMNQAFERSGNLRSPLGALSALAQLYAGSRIAGKEEEAANQRSRKLAEALMGATGNDQLIRTLFASGDPDLIKAGVASRIKTAEEAGHYGMNPVWVQKPDGSWGIAQLNSRGQPRIADFGEGITAAPPTFAVDTGTGTQITTRAGGQAVSTVKKDLAGAEREKAVGEGEGKAHLNVPAVEAAAARINRQLDAVRSDPNLPNVTGIESYMPTFLSKNKDTEAKIAQLGGSAFLQAFQDLRGGGAITDAEGAKATAALARLSESQSDAGFLQALDDFKREVQGLVDLARRKAGQAPAEVPPTAPPAAGNMRLKFNPETGELE